MAALGLAALVLTFGISRQVYFWVLEYKSYRTLKAELNTLLKQKNDLDRFIDYYSQPSNVEKESRLRLNLKRAGEEVVVFINNSTSSPKSGFPEVPLGGKPSNFEQWWYYFFH